MVNSKRTLLRLTTFVSLLISLFIIFVFSTGFTEPAAKKTIAVKSDVAVTDLYQKLHLQELGLEENAFNLAVKGWNKMKASGEVSKNILSICDFTQSSKNKRLYIIDMSTGTLL